MAFWYTPGGNPFDGYDDLILRPRRGPRPGARLTPQTREATRQRAVSRQAFLAKRRAQKELSEARTALATALDSGNPTEAATAAEQLAERKNDLLALSRSHSTLEMAEAADEELAEVPAPEEIPGCSKVRVIMEGAKPVVEGVEPFLERAERLKAELESLQKEYLRLDAHISRAQIALDGVETVGEGPNTARAMRRKANNYLTECLENIDEAVNPLRDMFQQELFKSSNFF
eukprot:scaffold194_cov277-Pinguiococcus_pyrenoidosus.AAC.13